MVIAASPVFVGRRSELRSLHDAFAEAACGRPQVVVVDGEPGSGKSALVDRFLAEAQPERTLRASGDESESSMPFAVADQLLRSDGGESTALQVDDQSVVGLELLARIKRAETRTVVVVDDAHLADPTSLRTLLFAARRLVDSVTMVIVVVSAGAQLPSGWHKLAAGSSGRALHVGPFDESSVADLAAALEVSMTADASLRLWEHTGGNPLYVIEVLRELPEDPAWQHEPRALPVPESYERAVQEKLGGCPADALALLQAAAVLGVRAPLHMVIELTNADEPLRALDLALGTGIVRLQDRGGAPVLEFSPHLARAAIYQALPTVRRSTLNAAAARIARDPEAALRHRVEAATMADDDLLAELEQRARDGVARGAWSGSVTSLISASRLTADAADRERLALEAIEAMLYSGDGAAARRFVERTGFSDGPRRDGVMAYLATLADDVDAAERMLKRAWDGRGMAGDTRLVATIAQRSAFLAASRMRGHDAIRWARRAEALAPSDPATGLLVAPSLALGYSYTGDRDAAHAALDRWLENPAAPHDGVGFILLALKGHLLLADGDVTGARRAFETSVAEGRQRGLLVVAALSLSGLSRALFLGGAWDDARAASEHAVRLALESEDRWLIARARWSATDVAAARGEWPLAEAHVRAIHEQRPRFERHVAVEAVAGATLAAAQDRPQDVLTALAPLDAIEPREGVEDFAFFPWQHLKANALLDLGELEMAEAFIRSVGELPTTDRTPLLAARLGHAWGRLHFARGDVINADLAYREATAVAEPLGMPYEQALIQLGHGQVLRRAGERRAASAVLLAARERLAPLGAGHALQRCETELAACGLAPASRRTRDFAALTPQERTVAQLVASGMTNREVSSELMLSAKTVEFHLGHVYAKLGVRSRSELRARVRAGELAL